MKDISYVLLLYPYAEPWKVLKLINVNTYLESSTISIICVNLKSKITEKISQLLMEIFLCYVGKFYGKMFIVPKFKTIVTRFFVSIRF